MENPFKEKVDKNQVCARCGYDKFNHYSSDSDTYYCGKCKFPRNVYYANRTQKQMEQSFNEGRLDESKRAWEDLLFVMKHKYDIGA